MSNKLCLAAVLVSASAFAQPSPPTPPPAPSTNAPAPHTCAKGGDALFEIDHKIDARMKDPNAPTALTVTSTGAWTLTTLKADGTAQSTASGCLDDAKLDQIRKDLAHADWKTERAGAHCMAISSEYTEYRAAGTLVYTARTCSPDHLDDASATSLADVEKILDAATKPAKMPCCKK